MPVIPAVPCYRLFTCGCPCAALGHCCSGMEKCCSKGCSCICGLKCCPKEHPSPIFLSYTLLFNVPMMLAAVVLAVKAFAEDCDGDMWVKLGVWDLVAAGCSFFFILFSIRVYMTLSKPYHPDIASGMEAGTSHQQPQSYGHLPPYSLADLCSSFILCQLDPYSACL